MAISGDYSTPVSVNGYSCRNCTDVEYAKKNIDPAHPKSGPFGSTAEDDPTARADARQRVTPNTPVSELRLLDVRA